MPLGAGHAGAGGPAEDATFWSLSTLSWIANGSSPDTSAHVERAARLRSRPCSECGRHRAVLCGLAHNIAGSFAATTASVRETGAMFADYRVVVYESDSSDGSPALLAAWQQSDPERITVISERKHSEGVRERIDRTILLASMRNRVLDVVRAMQDDAGPGGFAADVVVVGDLDFEFGWDVGGIASVFRPHAVDEQQGWFGPDALQPFDGEGRPTQPQADAQANVPATAAAAGADAPGSSWPYDWDAATAYGQQTGSGFVWDWAALRLRGLDLRNMIEDRAEAGWYPDLKRRLRHPDLAWLPVRCAFGGLGVYRAEALLAGRWEGDTSMNGCEHIGLCRSMAEAGYRRQFMVPSLVQLYDVRGGGRGWLKRLAESAGAEDARGADGQGLRLRARSGPVFVNAGRGERLRLPGPK